ncbi:uncharacterized protein FOMMEDRAFT_139574 [Fomitiporia mediterranea MF3/22]|uniref:uncharacterized protein n=1 Tax=Fomitiporia mediterranea (strain MF3/22) TaxID=694068 RepID=UPI0004407502|nr:uncharacterized protein FOMMEDRAFT_139574 [Fomitiporia mediterranea MF3/22]EJD04917.1 hypothetical protein FOMMEDRAFT_139574 [Fomitiporia mediterranea MF3/22]
MSFKSSNHRRVQDQAAAPGERGNPRIRQLQEMFPSWSDDDLKSVLAEVNYDVELAVVRISEGHAEQWGAVSRKKDKRATAGSPAPSSGDRGGSRGTRGGRGASRGGRGGGGRGAGRGGHREANGRHASSPAPQSSSTWTQESSTPVAGTDDASAASEWATANGASDQNAVSGQGDAGDSTVSVAASSSTLPKAKTDTTPSAWGNGTPAPSTELKPQALSPTPTQAAKLASKTPATSKMSWAQVARAQEKPKATPPPPAPAPASVPAAVPASAPEPVPAAPEPEQKVEPEADGWEEPTTVQAPPWEDEPPAQPTVKATSDGWITSVTEKTEIRHEPAPEEAQPTPSNQPEPESERVTTASAFPAQLGLQQKAEPSVVPPVKPSTPVSYARSLNSRAGHRPKVTDQAVVMPSSFGSSVEKLGMQFGSVNLGGEDVEPNALEPPTPEPPVAAPVASEPAREPQPPTTHAPPPEPAPAASTQTPLTSTQSLFQHTLTQHSQPQQPQPQVQAQIHSALQSAQQTPPSLLPTQPSTQSVIPSQTSTSTATSTPLTSFSAQQATPSSQSSVSPYQQSSAQQQTQAPQPQAPATQNHLQQQQQSSLHQFSHFPSHLEQAASQPSPPQAPQQQQTQQSALHQGIGSHGSYYRQPEQNFHHAPTPPAGQAQDTQYGSFAPLSQQLGYQTQASHLSGFNSDHFGYNDGARGFYESYGPQSGFSGRNALGHDDVGKSLPGSQQSSQSGAGLPQSAAQSTQQQASQQPQTGTQPQGPAAGQPQQGYPMPFYYNMYQPGQYYGTPYGSGYGLGQYANRYPQQQPPLFQPANPTSASPANAKGPNSVQPQSNPYAPGLYGQQQHASSAYDDGYGHHNQLGPQHNQGLPTNEYGKQLYGGQSIQSFMGQSSSPAAQLGPRGTGNSASPENSYKPYGPGSGVNAKDVGGAPGMGSSGIAGGQGALGQGGRGVQQPQHSQFYGANRFSANPNAGGPPGQQNQQQQTQGYPQGADSSFYYQRPSQNGPQYWG